MNLIATNTTTLTYSKVKDERIDLSMIVNNYNVEFALFVNGDEIRRDESYEVIAKAHEAYVAEALTKDNS